MSNYSSTDSSERAYYLKIWTYISPERAERLGSRMGGWGGGQEVLTAVLTSVFSTLDLFQESLCRFD